MKWFLTLTLIAAPGLAAACPTPADHSAELTTLIQEARNAASQAEGQQISTEMWQVYLRAPDARAQDMLDRGMQRRVASNYLGAYEDFDRLVAYCPTYAEGFNQRAFVQYLTGAFEGALTDLDAALRLNPAHVAAQSGRALTLMQLGRIEEARAQMLEALENNPWLSERALLEDGAPLGLTGQEL